ncbi:MAG: amidohydrolase [Ignisphaera sp.]|nr:amidohydrolase [Ignisphaera sp.]MCX8167458.1 amidohydrolase [Ignisphaera sp.]MDW8084678.1 amidohydrolase family protein [Ignisphaera sp.]
MKISDVHIHSSGRESHESIEKAFDESGIEKAVVISFHPHLLKDTWIPISVEEFRESVAHLSRIQRMLRGRVYGFSFVDPRMVGEVVELVKIVEWALTDRELVGVKMIPAEWYPYDEKLYPLYEKLEDLGAPILFHCGISWGFPDSSRFCRPVYFEALMRFRKLRFALAHLCWPWIDEALAVGGRFLYPYKYGYIASAPYKRPQIIFDISSGAPLMWKIDALQKAVAYLGAEMLMFGSDCSSADNKQCLDDAIKRDFTILKGILARTDYELETIFRRNFEWFVENK